MLLQPCHLVIYSRKFDFLQFYSSIVLSDFHTLMKNKFATLLQLLYGLAMKCYFDAIALKRLIDRDEVKSYSPDLVTI